MNFRDYLKESYNDVPKPQRNASKSDPAVVTYENKMMVGANYTLTTFMNIYGISKKHQKELADEILKTGTSSKMKIKKEFIAEFLKERGTDVNVELSLSKFQ